ncbi:MAG: glutaredoxin family protein [Burkholderiales bacterium]|nr:glutaredoxin family protein [Burkholderiales bacterium]
MRSLFFATAALAAALPALAQYKVVGPDGKVTYTDRPPTEQQGKATPMRVDAGGAPSTANLPAELRQVVQRFPVVLYTAPECAPCDAARTMLRQRGIPLAERTVASNDDVPLLERATGGRSVPAITVGAQATNGYSATQWNNLLDLAGYPRESRLPRDYAAAPATPIAGRPAPAPAPAPQPEREAPRPVAPPPVAEPASGIRF